MTSYECFTVEVAHKVAHLVLSRPDELNTMTRAFWRELPEIVDGLSAAGQTRALVVSSTGRHFSAGMDLAVFADHGAANGTEIGRARAQVLLSARALQGALSSLERARMPVLAAVQGGCVGGALDLVAACDLRYAADDAFFVIQETNIGMTADVGSLQRLPKVMPAGVVRELAYTGRRLPAQRAREVGLVNEVYASHDDLLAGVMDTAHEIAARSPLAVWGCKEQITYALDHTVADGLDYVAAWNGGLFQAPDLLEGMAARAEKRPASYDDLLPAPTGL